jgi:hypothetical protein
MDDNADFIPPPTQPSDSLVPPPRPPGTAIAAATPGPEPLPRRHLRHPRSFRDAHPVRRLIEQTLDAVDGLADALAGELGLRRL